MLNNMTRARVTEVWFAAVALVVVAAVALGANVTASTGAMLLMLSLVPPVIIFMLWPRAQPVTAGDVLHGTDHRS